RMPSGQVFAAASAERALGGFVPPAGGLSTRMRGAMRVFIDFTSFSQVNSFRQNGADGTSSGCGPRHASSPIDTSYTYSPILTRPFRQSLPLPHGEACPPAAAPQPACNLEFKTRAISTGD